MDQLIAARSPDLALINKKGTFKLVDFAIPSDINVLVKESENVDKYLDLTRELKS